MRYGSTDPKVFQLRDMNRRITRLEKRFENHILRQSALNERIATKVASLSASADLEEE